MLAGLANVGAFLFADPQRYVADGVQASVPASVRETVGRVGAIVVECGTATIMAVAHALKIDKSAASRRCRSAQTRGYIRNVETSKAPPARYVRADPLPAEQPVLPHPDALTAAMGTARPPANDCTVAGTSEGDSTPPSLEGLSRSEWRQVVI